MYGTNKAKNMINWFIVYSQLQFLRVAQCSWACFLSLSTKWFRYFMFPWVSCSKRNIFEINSLFCDRLVIHKWLPSLSDLNAVSNLPAIQWSWQKYIKCPKSSLACYVLGMMESSWYCPSLSMRNMPVLGWAKLFTMWHFLCSCAFYRLCG